MNYAIIQAKEYDTSLGDQDASALFIEEMVNRFVTVSNTGNTIYDVVGLPEGSRLGPGQTASYIYTGTDWRPVSVAETSEGGGGGGVGIGGVYWYASSVAEPPPGTLRCDGGTHAIQDYYELYLKIGNRYGGDGSSTFAVPDMDGIVFEDKDDGDIKSDSNGIWVIQAERITGDVSIGAVPAFNWIEVWGPSHGDAPAEEVPNQWGYGLFYAGIEYEEDNEQKRSNGTLAIGPEALDRSVIFAVDTQGGESSAVFTCSAEGVFGVSENGGDFSDPMIISIYKWEQVSGEATEPISDGWETVYTVPGNTDPVDNIWGTGYYEVIAAAGAGASFSFYLNVVDIDNNANSSSYEESDGNTTRVKYDGTLGQFFTIADGSPVMLYIKQIRKWSGVMTTKLVIEADGFSAWTDTLELPPFGEELPSGELFLDGTDSLISSEGREDLGGIVDYVPAVKNVDGSRYTPPELKWPERGTYGFFGEYENKCPEDPLFFFDATVEDEGDWKKIISSDVNGYATIADIGAGVTSVYAFIEIKRGSLPVARVQFIDNSGNGGEVFIDFRTQDRSFLSGAVDEGSFFVDDETFILKMSRTFSTPTSGTSNLRYYVGSSSLVGDYSYYRKQMLVTGLDYPVPYTPGIHQASKLPYNFDWAASDEWTIEAWFNGADTPLTNWGYRAGGNSTDGFSFLKDASNNLLVEYITGGSFNYGTITSSPSGYEHIKVILEPGRVRTYLDGVLILSETTNVPNPALMSKYLNVGSSDIPNSQFNGYVCDLRIFPFIDTSNDHYLSGLPYYDPQKTYGKNAMWSIDHDGQITDQADEGLVETEDIADDAVTTAKIADGAVTEPQIGTGAVSTDKVQDEAITANKLEKAQRTYYQEIDTNAGDVAISLPSDPVTGTQVVVRNSGTSGNHVTGLPDSIKLGDQKVITLTRFGSDWRYEDVIIEEYQSGNQNVTKYANGQMFISGTDNQDVSCNIAAGALFRNEGNVRVDYVESFVVTTHNVIVRMNITSGVKDTVSCRPKSRDADGFTYYMFTNVTKGNLSYNISFVSEGRWK